MFARTGTRLLTADEERALSGRMWQGRRRLRIALNRGVDCWEEAPPVPALHDRALTPRSRSSLLDAERRATDLRSTPSGALGRVVTEELAAIGRSRDALFTHNVRLVAWVAKSYQGRGLDLLDLFQEGSIALLFSIDRFDPARSVRLSSYATRAVRLGILRALSEKGRAIRIPTYRLGEALEVAAARHRLLGHLSREPTADEVAEDTSLTRERLDELLAAVRPVDSLDAAVTDGGRALSEVLASEAVPSFVERVERTERLAMAERALEQLTERQRRIVELRFGIGDDIERSYESIGSRLGLSRERTRQLERSACEKMRDYIEREHREKGLRIGPPRPSSHSIH